MSALAKLTAVELKLNAREFVGPLITIVLPTALLVVFGMIPASRQPSADLGGQRAIDTTIPSMAVTITLAMAAFFMLPGVLGTYREKGILRRMRTTPVSPKALLTAQVITQLLTALASIVLVFLVGGLALDMGAPQHIAGFALSMVLGLGALYALGLVVAAVASSARAATGLSMVFFFPSMFFAGLYLPKEAMPHVLSKIGDVTPLGAFRQSVQDSWVGGGPQALTLLALAGWLVVLAAVATRAFRWE
ncbi:ABC transporter permease [Labedaea rhizosphaerae]|uniref:Transport permease protein n=1 Tax=Labedaea rhizosphaerae TaxID=598644 RepID=A0A4R6S035_LABRH|nr:ABC transporter permease [Labedaea rhizosphaerae]TDP91935.1 ABC-2 type transport system permease protein [Labedaea rhizosphaerae]